MVFIGSRLLSCFDSIVCVCVCVAVLRRSIRGAASGDASDSEEELAAFCPSVCCLNMHFQKVLTIARSTKHTLSKHINRTLY